MSAAPDNRAQGASSMSSLLQSMRSGAAAPVVVLAMLSMVVVPLPPFLLDLLFTVNIAMSLMVLLGTGLSVFFWRKRYLRPGGR